MRHRFLQWLTMTLGEPDVDEPDRPTLHTVALDLAAVNAACPGRRTLARR